jgi:uncharacterized membrane protein YqiK
MALPRELEKKRRQERQARVKQLAEQDEINAKAEAEAEKARVAAFGKPAPAENKAVIPAAETKASAKRGKK